jgi:hypothetical protein
VVHLLRPALERQVQQLRAAAADEWRLCEFKGLDKQRQQLCRVDVPPNARHAGHSVAANDVVRRPRRLQQRLKEVLGGFGHVRAQCGCLHGQAMADHTEDLGAKV